MDEPIEIRVSRHPGHLSPPVDCRPIWEDGVLRVDAESYGLAHGFSLDCIARDDGLLLSHAVDVRWPKARSRRPRRFTDE